MRIYNHMDFNNADISADKRSIDPIKRNQFLTFHGRCMYLYNYRKRKVCLMRI